MTDGVMFDNIIITHDKSVADDFADKTWKISHDREKQKLEEDTAEKEEKVI